MPGRSCLLPTTSRLGKFLVNRRDWPSVGEAEALGEPGAGLQGRRWGRCACWGLSGAGVCEREARPPRSCGRSPPSWLGSFHAPSGADRPLGGAQCHPPSRCSVKAGHTEHPGSPREDGSPFVCRSLHPPVAATRGRRHPAEASPTPWWCGQPRAALRLGGWEAGPAPPPPFRAGGKSGGSSGAAVGGGPAGRSGSTSRQPDSGRLCCLRFLGTVNTSLTLDCVPSTTPHPPSNSNVLASFSLYFQSEKPVRDLGDPVWNRLRCSWLGQRSETFWPGAFQISTLWGSEALSSGPDLPPPSAQPLPSQDPCPVQKGPALAVLGQRPAGRSPVTLHLGWFGCPRTTHPE